MVGFQLLQAVLQPVQFDQACDVVCNKSIHGLGFRMIDARRQVVSVTSSTHVLWSAGVIQSFNAKSISAALVQNLHFPVQSCASLNPEWVTREISRLPAHSTRFAPGFKWAMPRASL